MPIYLPIISTLSVGCRITSVKAIEECCFLPTKVYVFFSHVNKVCFCSHFDNSTHYAAFYTDSFVIDE